MRTLLFPVLSAVLLLSARSASVAAETASVPLVQSAERSAHFAAVNRHLDLGGVLYGYVDVDGDVEKLGAGLNELAGRLAALQPELAMLKQDYGPLLGTLGLTDVKAIGFSSVRTSTGYRNRTFLYTPNERHGLLLAFGGAAHAFTEAHYAPANADLFFETDIEIPAAYTALKQVLAKIGGDSWVKTIESELQKKTPDGIVPYDVIQHLTGRFTFVGRVDPEETLTIPGKTELKLPGVSFMVRLDGVGESLEAALAALPSLHKTVDSGRTLYEMQEPVAGKSLQPVFAIDGTAVVLANNRMFLNECLSRVSGLDEQADFKAALALTGHEGNGVSYVTPRFFDQLREVLTAIRDREPETKLILDGWSNELPKIDRPLISVRTNQADGILVQSVWHKSLKQDVAMAFMANPVTVGLLAAMAIPAFQKVRVSSMDKTIQNNLRQYRAAGQQFMLETGKSTATYQDLVGENKYIKSLKPVAGEDYTKLVLKTGKETLSVRKADGKVITLP